jgi:hypothetical protein
MRHKGIQSVPLTSPRARRVTDQRRRRNPNVRATKMWNQGHAILGTLHGPGVPFLTHETALRVSQASTKATGIDTIVLPYQDFWIYIQLTRGASEWLRFCSMSCRRH